MAKNRQPNTTKEKSMYRVVFRLENKKIQLYAGNVLPSKFLGLVQIEDIAVKQERSALLVDPELDHIRSEFGNTKVLHIPIQSLVRIEKLQPAPTSNNKGKGSKVVPLNQ